MTQRQLPRGVTERRTRDGVLVQRIHYTADPERDPAINPEWEKKERKKYSSQARWESEQNIVYSAGGGERLFADILAQWGHKIIIDHPEFLNQVPPQWRPLGGFDHGKTNPTGALASRVDYEGCIYILREYYQPGLSPAQHAPFLKQLKGFLDGDAMADPSIFYKTQFQQATNEWKAFADLYAEEGITNLVSAPDNTEIVGMERILAHWMNLDEREPTLKIVCPKHKQDIQRPLYGLHNDGCPNLLWELRRTRREELSATQLVNKNPSEKIVDKDNHLRDPLKYIVLSLPEPSTKSAEQIIMEKLAPQGLDLTSASIRAEQYRQEMESQHQPISLGRLRRR